MHRVQERLRILFARAPSPIAIPLHTRLDDMEGRIRGVHEGCVYIGARVHCAGRESRNNNDNNDRDDNIGSKIRRGERERRNTCGESWVLRKPSNQAISGFASFLNPWSGSLRLSIPITCSFLRIPITKGERNGINAPLLHVSRSPNVSRASFHVQRLIPRFWTNIRGGGNPMTDLRHELATSASLSRLSGFSGN